MTGFEKPFEGTTFTFTGPSSPSKATLFLEVFFTVGLTLRFFSDIFYNLAPRHKDHFNNRFLGVVTSEMFLQYVGNNFSSGTLFWRHHILTGNVI